MNSSKRLRPSPPVGSCVRATWCHSFVASAGTSPGNGTSLIRLCSYRTHFTLLLSKRRERIRRSP